MTAPPPGARGASPPGAPGASGAPGALPPLDDAELARTLAGAAGKLLLSVRAGEGWGRELGRRGDRVANRYLVDALRSQRAGDAILSEEEVDDPARLEAERVWIIDPLDGTREFAEPGRPDWAVHVALWAGSRIAAAAVALPAEGLTLSTADAPPPPPGRAGRRRLVVSRSRPPAGAAKVAAALDAELVALGSAGAKAMAVVRGDADAYLHTGGQSEWDSAAPVGVALAAGLHASRVNGAPLVYNQRDPSLPDLLICRPELAGLLLAAVAAAGVA